MQKLALTPENLHLNSTDGGKQSEAGNMPETSRWQLQMMTGHDKKIGGISQYSTRTALLNY